MNKNPDVQQTLEEIESRLESASDAFKSEISRIHGALNQEFAATDKALEEFVDELEKGKDDTSLGSAEA